MANPRKGNKSFTRANPSSNKSTFESTRLASPSVANTAAAAPAPAQRLDAERSLKEFLENSYQRDEEEFKRACQNMLRSLIGAIADLELKGITRGPLTGENILVIGNKAEKLKLKILNTPRENNPDMPSYRGQFLTLASEVVHAWEATCSSESNHFLKMIEYDMCRCDFKQLQWHPLLLSSKERATFVIHLYTYLETEKKGWRKDYRKVITRRNVDICNTLSGEGGFFCDVYNFKGFKYPRNALGALLFYRNAHVHVNDYIYKHQKRNKELLKEALLTTEQKENKLACLFPDVVLELFSYVFEKGIDINAVI